MPRSLSPITTEIEEPEVWVLPGIDEEETVKSSVFPIICKHLPGKHDQQTHGHDEMSGAEDWQRIHGPGGGFNTRLSDKIANYQLPLEHEPREFDPDEPHWATDVDALYVVDGHTVDQKVVARDTSPKNAKVDAKAIRAWTTPYTKEDKKNGSAPWHSNIRAAACRLLGLTPMRESSHRGWISNEELTGMAKSILGGIFNGEPAQPKLWRGMTEMPEDTTGQLRAFVNQKPGDVFDVPMFSATRDATVAASYGVSSLKKLAAFLRIKSGSRGYAVRSYYKHDQEVITGGRFRVLSIDKLPDAEHYIVSVEQIGVFDPDKMTLVTKAFRADWEEMFDTLMIDKRQKQVKHLPGKHDQKTHGHSKGGGITESRHHTDEDSLDHIEQYTAYGNEVTIVSSPDENEKVGDITERILGKRLSQKDIANWYVGGLDGIGEKCQIDMRVMAQGGMIYISGHVTGEESGDTVMRFTRYLTQQYGDKLSVVDHDSLTVTPKYNKKGIGTAFFFASEDAYRKAGVDYIQVHADRSVGGYAWARMGFDFEDETELTTIRSDFVSMATSILFDTPQGRAAGRTVLEAATAGFRFPYEFATYQTSKNGEVRDIGREVMRMLSWRGVKSLKRDSDVITAGNSYHKLWETKYGKKK